MMNHILIVGFGGGLGAIMRYLMTFLPIKYDFPFITLLTNILGAIVIGFVVGMFESQKISSSLQLFWKTGFCGGFTTFSTFSLETVQFLENGKILIAIIYMILSFIGCIFGVILGKWIQIQL